MLSTGTHLVPTKILIEQVVQASGAPCEAEDPEDAEKGELGAWESGPRPHKIASCQRKTNEKHKQQKKPSGKSSGKHVKQQKRRKKRPSGQILVQTPAGSKPEATPGGGMVRMETASSENGFSWVLLRAKLGSKRSCNSLPLCI